MPVVATDSPARGARAIDAWIGAPIDDGRAPSFAGDWNRRPFEYAHSLENHPMLALDTLVGVAKRIPVSYWRNNASGVAGGWGRGVEQRHTLEDTIRNMAETDSLVVLKHAEQDPEIGALLRDALQRIADRLWARQVDDILVGEALVFINSPHRTTHYHIDAEAVFVAQVAGEKTFRVYDKSDRSILSESEIEDFLCGNLDAATLRPASFDRSPDWLLTPGKGVHIPALAPHWAKSGGDVAVSVTFAFELESSARLRRRHRFDRARRKVLSDLRAREVAPAGRSVLDLGRATLDRVRARLGTTPRHDEIPRWTPRRRSID